MFSRARAKTNTSNDKIRKILSEDEYKELDAQVKLDMQALQEGRTEDALLLQSLADNWSIPDLMKVARRRGKTWRWLSALADKQNEITGMALLSDVVTNILANYNHAVLQKTLNAMARNNNFYEQYEKEHCHDEYTEQVMQDMQERLMRLAGSSYDHLERRLQEMLGRVLNEKTEDESRW